MRHRHRPMGWVRALAALTLAGGWTAIARNPAAAQTNNTTMLGGAGGSSATISCNADEVLVGIKGRAGFYVDRIGGICTHIDGTGRWIGNRRDTGQRGGSNSSAPTFTRRCESGYAVAGIRGRAGMFVDRLQIICYRLSTGGMIAGGTSRTLSAVGGTGGVSKGPYYCQDNVPARGLRVRYGSYVDATGLGCSRPIVGFGWIATIHTGNTNEPVTTRLGSAEDAISGHSIGQIVNRADVKVRADNMACQSCHTGSSTPGGFNAATVSRSAFCGLVPRFANANKPPILKTLFSNWRNRGCVD